MLILCTGSSGIVGWNFINSALNGGHKVIAVSHNAGLPDLKNLTRAKLDLDDEGKLQRLVLDSFPDVIVNCAAMSSPADVDANPDVAERINVAAARRIAHLANHVNARLIHISTDMVFDGTAAPYKNTDKPMPMNLYGQTKLMAEKEVLKIMAPQSVVLRISHVSGNSFTRRRSLHEKLFMAWAKGEKVRLASNDIRMPCSAGRLADVLCEITERPSLSGIYHYCGLDALSRYEIGEKICLHFGLDPTEFIEKFELPSPLDLSMDMGCLAPRIKTMNASFDSLLSEMQVPPDCEAWYEGKTGRKTVKRFKL